jgi:two-component system, LuxR family, sensor kinase FixL
MRTSAELQLSPLIHVAGWSLIYVIVLALETSLGAGRSLLPSIWLPIGIALGAFVAIDILWWPLLAALAIASSVAVELLIGADPGFAAVTAAGDIGVAALAATALKTWVKGGERESIAAVSTLSAATLAGALLWSLAVASSMSSPLTVIGYASAFAASVSGALLVGLPLVALDSSGSGFGSAAAARESAILLAVAMLFSLSYTAPFFGGPAIGHLVVAASTPVVCWAAMRRGMTVALLVLLVVKLAPMIMFITGFNPLGIMPELDFLEVQAATIFVGAAAVIIAAAPGGHFGMLTQTRVRANLMSAIEETSSDAVVTIDAHGIVQSFSAAGERLFGYAREEVEGRNVTMLMPHHFRAEHDNHIARYLQSGEKHIIGIGRVVAGQRKDGTTFPIELAVGESRIDGRPLFVGFIRDLTAFQREQRRAQELQQQLFHVSRLTEMGQIASGLVHEVNQPLAAIMNYLQASRHLIARNGSGANAQVDGMLGKAEASATRAAEIMKRLRAFIDRREVERRNENANMMIEESLALGLVGPAGKSVGVRLELASDLPQVYVDRVQIQQVIVNLVRNAVDAMGGGPRRELRIRSAMDADNLVCIAVSDTGPGVSPEVADKLFGAFITTKTEGMGVGLSICKSIIDNHGGEISFANNANAPGTTFRFTLPAASRTTAQT